MGQEGTEQGGDSQYPIPLPSLDLSSRVHSDSCQLNHSCRSVAVRAYSRQGNICSLTWNRPPRLPPPTGCSALFSGALAGGAWFSGTELSASWGTHRILHSVMLPLVLHFFGSPCFPIWKKPSQSCLQAYKVASVNPSLI